jgi:hypothetical protein
VKGTIALVLSALAFAVAVSGTAAVAGGLIDGSQIANHSIHRVKLAKDARAKRGKRGRRGFTGPQGLAGPKGDAGAKGDTGATGAQGAQGLQGLQGAQGPQGQRGPQGLAGDGITSYVMRLNADPNNGPATHYADAYGWQKREGTDTGTHNGQADILNGHLVLTEPDDAGTTCSYGAGCAFSGATFPLPSGTKLKDLTALLFSERATGGQNGYNAPYFRIFLNGYQDDVVMSPSLQGAHCTLDSTTWTRWNVLDDGVRYDNDAGGGCGIGPGADSTWADVLAAHGNEPVDAIRVQAGDGGAYSNDSKAFIDDVVIGINGVLAKYDFGA